MVRKPFPSVANNTLLYEPKKFDAEKYATLIMQYTVYTVQLLYQTPCPFKIDHSFENRRPAVEYIRDVYAELVGMGEGVRRPGDRSDISSDEEDEMEVRWWNIKVGTNRPHRTNREPHVLFDTPEYYSQSSMLA